jgi:hypothetical protein
MDAGLNHGLEMAGGALDIQRLVVVKLGSDGGKYASPVANHNL